MPEPLALDLSLEKARAMHRIWRALNDGDCPRCHQMRPATAMLRDHADVGVQRVAVQCPGCGFYVTREEIQDIEHLFAPAMEAALAIFEEWRAERSARTWPGTDAVKPWE